MESFNFDIDLVGIGFDDRWPRCAVYINETMCFNGEVKDDLKVNFNADVNEGENNLIIDFYNRNYVKDVILGQDGLPEKFTGIEVKNVSIDEIHLGHIPYYKSSQYIYEPWYLKQGNKDLYPNPRKEDMQLSWNGRWILPFTSPLYIWLLDNL